MNTISRWAAAAAASLSLSAIVLAQAPALDVKMGLWEITSTTNIGGQIPTIDTSRMTPEQKARMEAAMKGLVGPHSNVTKSCMTKEKFNRSSFMTDGDPGATCKQTMSTNTRTSMDANVVCTGKRTTTSQMHIDAPSPTSFTGSVKSASAEQGQTMTVNVTMTGKWLGADCGTVQ
jgi:hypothetical protein